MKDIIRKFYSHAYVVSLTRALHPEEEEHGDDGEERPDGVGDDELERVVVGDEQDVQHCRGRQVARQQARRVRQDGARLDHVQAEERYRPHAVEYLQEGKAKGGVLGLYQM